MDGLMESLEDVDSLERAAMEEGERRLNDEVASTGGVQLESQGSHASKKQKKLTSDVWSHFTRISETHVMCNHCEQQYAQKTKSHGTTTLQRHLSKICSKKPLYRNVGVMFKDFEGNMKSSKKFKQKVVEEKLTKCIVSHNLSFYFCEI